MKVKGRKLVGFYSLKGFYALVFVASIVASTATFWVIHLIHTCFLKQEVVTVHPVPVTCDFAAVAVADVE